MSEKRVVPEQFQGRKIYSISRLLSYNNCKHGYHLRYNKRLKGTSNIYSTIGSRVHSLLEDMQFDRKTNEEALSEFRSSLFECTEILGLKFMTDKVRDNFVNSIEHYLKNYNKIDCKSFKSELEFYVEICGAVFVGYIDGTILNHDGTVEVVDYKTSSKYAKDKLDEHGLQLVMYAIALEQAHNIKVNKVKWNMLKYCQVNWQGATKPRSGFWLRSDLVKSLRSELKKDLRSKGMGEAEIEMLLDEAQSKNDMSLLPQDVQDKYTISDGYVEYELSERTKKMLFDFVETTVKAIESSDVENEQEWLANEITSQNSFFCSTLCDMRAHCKAYQSYLTTLDEGLISHNGTTSSMSDDELFKSIFGE